MIASAGRNLVAIASAGNNYISMSTSNINNDNSRVDEKNSPSSFRSFGDGFRQHSSGSKTRPIMCNRRRRKVTPIACTSNGLSESQTSVLQQDTSCSSTAATKSTMSNSYGSSSSTSSSSRIRSRYLHRLGVVGPNTAIPTSSSPIQSSVAQNVSKSRPCSSSQPLHRISSSVSTTEALKDRSHRGDQQRCDESNPRNQPPSSLSCIQEEPTSGTVNESSLDQSSISREEDDDPQYDETASTSSHQSVVSFDSTVKVHFIPKRQEYSNRIKNSMWTDPQEMQLNAARNVLEFAAENWDWRQATEEKDMVIVDDHTLVHPVHLHRQCNLQRQFLKIMSARRQF